MRVIILVLTLLYVSCSSPSSKTEKAASIPVDTPFINDARRVSPDSLLIDSASQHGEFVSNQWIAQLEPIGYTNDFEQIFSSEQVHHLDSLMAAFQQQSSVEFAVVTLGKKMIGDNDFNQLIVDLHNKWGVGLKKNNNGIVLGFSASARKVRITNGFGIEKKLTNARTKEILDSQILPYFKEEKYFEGTESGLLALMKELRKLGF